MNKKKKTIFHSFQEVAEYLGFNIIKTTPKKNEEQIVRFKKYHLCPACHLPMTYCGGNIMVCQNNSCKGLSYNYTNPETGEVRTRYTACYHILDEKGEKIAERLLSE